MERVYVSIKTDKTVNFIRCRLMLWVFTQSITSEQTNRLKRTQYYLRQIELNVLDQYFYCIFAFDSCRCLRCGHILK